MSQQTSENVTRVAIGGLGAIGQSLAKSLVSGAVPGYKLTAVTARRHDKAAEFLTSIGSDAKVVTVDQLEPLADMVIECAPAEILCDIVEPFVKAGKMAVVLSAGALLFNLHLVETAARHGGVIHVPTGALIGLDTVIAAAQGKIHSVRMVTRKPPRGLVGAPHLVENNIQVEGLTEPLKVFDGNALDAARGFPANVNVVAALSLAGIGPENTFLEVWADPGVSRNIHSIIVDSDSAKFSMTTENLPSENPKTGKIVAQSVVALLKKMKAPLRVGT